MFNREMYWQRTNESKGFAEVYNTKVTIEDFDMNFVISIYL